MEAWASGEIGLVVIRPAGSERGRESGHVITQSPSMEGDHVTTLTGENLDTAGNRDAQSVCYVLKLSFLRKECKNGGQVLKMCG